MKKNLMKSAALLLAVMMLAGALSGCGLDRDAEVAIKMGKENIYLDEVKLYVYSSQLEMESTYSIYIQYLYQDAKSFFEAPINSSSETTFWEYNLTRACAQIYQTKVLNKEAAKAGVTLTADEQKKVDEAYKSFVASYPALIRKAGASDELVRTFITENAIANKYYTVMTEGYPTDYNEEDVIGKRFCGVYIQALTVKAEEKDEADGGEDTESAAADASTEEAKEELYTEEELQAHLDAAMEKAMELLKQSQKPSDVVEAFKDDLTVSASTISSRVVTKATSSNETYPYYEKAWAMSTGDYTSFTAKDANDVMTGYLLYMEDDNDEDARTSAIESLYISRRADIFEEKYAELTSKTYKDFDVYTSVVASILYPGDLLSSSSATGTTAAPTTAAATEEATATEK